MRITQPANSMSEMTKCTAGDRRVKVNIVEKKKKKSPEILPGIKLSKNFEYHCSSS